MQKKIKKLFLILSKKLTLFKGIKKSEDKSQYSLLALKNNFTKKHFSKPLDLLSHNPTKIIELNWGFNLSNFSNLKKSFIYKKNFDLVKTNSILNTIKFLVLINILVEKNNLKIFEGIKVNSAILKDLLRNTNLNFLKLTKYLPFWENAEILRVISAISKKEITETQREDIVNKIKLRGNQMPTIFLDKSDVIEILFLNLSESLLKKIELKFLDEFKSASIHDFLKNTELSFTTDIELKKLISDLLTPDRTLGFNTASGVITVLFKNLLDKLPDILFRKKANIFIPHKSPFSLKNIFAGLPESSNIDFEVFEICDFQDINFYPEAFRAKKIPSSNTFLNFLLLKMNFEGREFVFSIGVFLEFFSLNLDFYSKYKNKILNIKKGKKKDFSIAFGNYLESNINSGFLVFQKKLLAVFHELNKYLEKENLPTIDLTEIKFSQNNSQ